MPIQIPQTSEDSLATALVQNHMRQLLQLATVITTIRKNGFPPRPASAPRQLSNGQFSPGFPGSPGVSAEAYEKALVAENRAILDLLAGAVLPPTVEVPEVSEPTEE